MRTYSGASPLQLPCGQCIGCRISKAAEWTTRLMHENQMHQSSSFLTLTFNDEHLPIDFSINIRDIQLFIKRYRKLLGHNHIRYFACGEYGDAEQRPHYHALIFGHEFQDRRPWRRTGSGAISYRSETLEKLWPFGNCELSDVTEQSINYVARYMLKKVKGEAAASHYMRVHPITGEVCQVEPEFVTMSTRPGIGADWFKDFASDAFPSDFVVINGIKRPVPLYYKRKLIQQEGEPDPTVINDKRMSTAVTRKRKARGFRRKADNTPERLAVREESLTLKVRRLKRGMEEES